MPAAAARAPLFRLLLALATLAQSSRSPFTRCTGETGKVSAELWEEVRSIQQTDTLGRQRGVTIDLRSDSLVSLQEVLEQQVMPDLDGAVKDCVFGVVSLVLLTLPLTEAKDGLGKARELLAMADRLYFQSLELLSKAEWPLDPDSYHGYQLLLGTVPSDCAGTILRVFIYNSTQDLSRMRLRTAFGMMGAASHVHAFLESAPCITQDPTEADFFFIPAYHGDQYSEFLSSRVHGEDVEQLFPYLGRRRGADHVFVVSANLPGWTELKPLRHAIQLTVESFQVNDDIPRWYSPWKDVMVPGYIDRWRIDAMRQENRPTDKRGFTLVFHGNHPGTHHLYVKHKAVVRTKILEAFAGLPDCSVGGHTVDFFERMGRSHFCLVPRGSSAWTIHLYESFFFGCIPVILSDELEMPFQDLLDWPSFSIKWPEERVGEELLTHLRSIPLDTVAEMKRRLEEASCWFDYHRGWGYAPQAGEVSWAKRGDNAVAVSGDCAYRGHGDASSLAACKGSCDRDSDCNVFNFLSEVAAPDEMAPDCVLRSCRDPAQPTLTFQAMGYEVWARLTLQEHLCSPFAGIMRSLEARARQKPFTHGAFWS